MPSEKLSKVQIARAPKPSFLNDGAGLYLRTLKSGAQMWVFRYALNKHKHYMGLGSAETFNLADAREAAREARKLVYAGLDPIERRRQQRGARALEKARAMTFRQCAEAYIAAHTAGWSNSKHAQQWGSTLAEYVYPTLGALPVQAIDKLLVVKVLEPIWEGKTETAARLRGRIEAVLNWAAAHGFRQGENPAKWRGGLDHLLPKRSKVTQVVHHPALAYRDLPRLIGELRRREGIGPLALQFAILSCARTDEAIGAVWSEIDFVERVWVVPAARMKGRRQHRVPLAGAALAILEEVRGLDERVVFPGAARGRTLSENTFLRLLRQMGYAVTMHGFRSTFSDWAVERTSLPAEARQMALAHRISDRVEAAYRRSDMFEIRRQLAESWADFCGSEQLTAGDR
jgi:integrase